MSRILRCLLCVGILAAPLRSEVERFALVIGNDEGLAGERPLRYAARDATLLADCLRGSGAFRRDRVRLLANSDAGAIRAAVRALRDSAKALRRAGRSTMALVYFSGHGSAGALHAAGASLDRAEVESLFADLGSDLRILILDACESGDFLRRKGGEFLEDREIQRVDELRAKGSIVLSASARGEAAQESEDYRDAVFTHHLLNGLRGLADYNRDGKVTVLEAFAYAQDATRLDVMEGSGARQNPGFDFDLVGESDIPLTMPGQGGARIVLTHMPACDLEVYNGRTWEREYRLRLTGKDSAYFAAPSGSYALVYAAGEAAMVARAEAGWGQARVDKSDFRPRPRSALRRKGGFLDWRRNLAGAEAGWLRPTPGRGLWTYGLRYARTAHAWEQELGLGWGRGNFQATQDLLTERDDAFAMSYACLFPLYRGVRLSLSAGAGVGAIRLRQELRDHRFDGQQVDFGELGLAPVQVRWATIYRGGIPVQSSFDLPWGLRLSTRIQAGVEAYRKVDGGREFAGFLEPGLGVGAGF